MSVGLITVCNHELLSFGPTRALPLPPYPGETQENSLPKPVPTFVKSYPLPDESAATVPEPSSIYHSPTVSPKIGTVASIKQDKAIKPLINFLLDIVYLLLIYFLLGIVYLLNIL